MNSVTMKWLLRREFWEHKGAMLWAPLVVGALLVALIGGTLVYGMAHHHLPTMVTINDHTVGGTGASVDVPLDTRTRMASLASSLYLGTSVPLFAVLAGTMFSYCLGALYNERRDRSILFWKSLPVSDPMTVLSKAATAMLVGPLITIVLATITSLVLLFVVCLALSFNGINLFGAILASPDFYLSPLRLLALLPVYAVWALPTVGWLLLVSSWARAKPLSWAIGIPVVSLILVKWVSVSMASLAGTPLNIMHYASDVVARLLGGVVPGIWFTFTGAVRPDLHMNGGSVDVGNIVTQSWASLAGPDAWIGAALGAAMLYAAMRLRRYRDEG